jgi:hypothetical protein
MLLREKQMGIRYGSKDDKQNDDGVDVHPHIDLHLRFPVEGNC